MILDIRGQKWNLISAFSEGQSQKVVTGSAAQRRGE